MPEAPCRAVIYARLSLSDLESEGEQSRAVQRQVSACRDLARAKRLEVAEVHTDDGISAYAGKPRPGFDAALDTVARGDAEVIVCWDLDRLARRLADLQRVHDLAKACPTLAVETVRGQGFSLGDAGGRMLSQILTLVAEHESAHRGERVAARARQRALSGALPPKTYGYDPETGEPVEPAASAVRAAYDEFVRTQSVTAAQKALTAADPDAPSSRNGVRELLTRATYAGIVTYRGAERPDATAQWQPLIPEADWRRVQAILSRPARRYAKHDRGARTALLTGLVLCGRCGEPMQASTQHGGAGALRYPVYACAAGNEHLRRKARQVEAYVIAVMMARLGLPDAQATVLPRDPEPGAADLAAKWADLRDRRSAVADALAQGLMDAGDYQRLAAGLAADQSAIEESLAALQTSPETGAPIPADPAYALVGTSLGGLRTVISTLAEITLRPAGRGRQPFRPETVEVTWRKALPPHAPGSGLAAVARPSEEWWEEMQGLVDGGMGGYAEALVAAQPPPPLSVEQRRALWEALTPAAALAADAEIGE